MGYGGTFGGKAFVAKALAQTNDFTLVVPAGMFIDRIFIFNNTANAITGGINVGTAAAGAQVISAKAIGASVLAMVTEAELLLRFFSKTAAQTLHVSDVTAWNSASIDFHVMMTKLY